MIMIQIESDSMMNTRIKMKKKMKKNHIVIDKRFFISLGAIFCGNSFQFFFDHIEMDKSGNICMSV